MVRIGKPETVLVELAKTIGADAIYAHREVSHDEVKSEDRIESAMKEENVEVKYFWGSTLYHMDDLPFKLEDMPTNYGGFREKVKGLEVRKTIEALDQMKGLPSRGDVEPGDVPSLMDLGLNPSASIAQVCVFACIFIGLVFIDAAFIGIVVVVLGQHDLVLQGVVRSCSFCYTLGLVHFNFEHFGLGV